MLWWSSWSLLMAVALTAVGAKDQEEEGNNVDNIVDEVAAAAAATTTRTTTTTTTSGGLFGPQLRTILGALENVDDMLRTTIPVVDRFQCLERLMCSLSSSQLPPTSPQVPAFPIFDPTFQQGIIQDPSTIGQGFPGFQPPPTGQFGQGNLQTLQAFPGGTSFQGTFPNFRENPENQDQNTHRRESRPPVLRRRRPIRKRPQRRGMLDFLSRLGKRKKRSIFDDLLGGFTSDRFLGVLDQMMTKYSFYPYTHAAYMGYTGTPTRCENLYPSCPTTPEEMIDVFNNIHKHYPGGIPFKDKLPWPLNILLP